MENTTITANQEQNESQWVWAMIYCSNVWTEEIDQKILLFNDEEKARQQLNLHIIDEIRDLKEEGYLQEGDSLETTNYEGYIFRSRHELEFSCPSEDGRLYTHIALKQIKIY